jgi:hypothetical protein
MHIKVLNPKTNGKNAYSNTGSARQAANYLEHEAKQEGEKAVFFSSENTQLTGDDAVTMLDSNRKGLRADDAKFYSLVISPSEQELAHIGSDPVKLQAYTRDVMHAYAENFNLKDGRKLAEKDLVWVATQHNERTARGTDSIPSGSKKEGLQTHIHIMVSARDREQKITLNPLGTVQRFNQVRFSATGNVIFSQKFDYEKPAHIPSRSGRNPTDVPREAVDEKEASIRRRMAANGRKTPLDREPKELGQREAADPRPRNRSQRPAEKLTPEQEQARNKRLEAQVDRINKKLGEGAQLDFAEVKNAGQARDFDKTFYSRLGRIGRQATAGSPLLGPYELLRTGRVKKVDMGPEITPSGPPKLARKASNGIPGVVMVPQLEKPKPKVSRLRPGQAANSKFRRDLGGVGSAMDPHNRTQDVRGQWERD